MRKFLLGLIFLASGFVHAQETPTVTTPRFGDDTYVHVPLQFGFPFYGRTFTNSWMHSNGVVSFLDPAVPLPDVGYNPAQWAYCCGDRPTTTKPQFQYMIAPLWTDLYPTGESSFRTEGTSQYQKYFWTNLGEISNTSNKNTFSLEIQPSGFIGVDYTQINGNQNYWVGTVGLPSAGEINEIYYGRLGVNNSIANLQNWTVNNATGVGDQCLVDPLSSPTCAGYTTAMCASNPLYSTSCAGYAAAYYNQQCSINTLYDVGCPGYAAAYLEQQCSLDPLYSTTCQGYEQAYFDQQCSLDALYSSTCPGYEVAYFDQQCSLNTLYSNQCPGYEVAYFDQQCSLDALYSNQCPGYAEAYALKNIVVTTPVVETATTTTSKSTEVAVVADPVVNDVIKTTTTSTSPATSATAVVTLTPTTDTATTTTVAEVTSTTTEEKKEETNDTSTSVSETVASTTTEKTSEKKTEQPTMREQIVANRKAAAMKAAITAGKQATEEMGTATSMAAQVAVQNVVIAAMGFTPGFQTYNVIMPDGVGYKPFTVYNNQKNVDNRRVSFGLTGPSDKLHEQMVASQWEN